MLSDLFRILFFRRIICSAMITVYNVTPVKSNGMFVTRTWKAKHAVDHKISTFDVSSGSKVYYMYFVHSQNAIRVWCRLSSGRRISGFAEIFAVAENPPEKMRLAVIAVEFLKYISCPPKNRLTFNMI